MRSASIFGFMLVVLLSSNFTFSTHFIGVSLVSNIFIDTTSSTEVVQVIWRLIWKLPSLSSRLSALYPCNPGPCTTEPWPPYIVMGSGDSCKQTVNDNQVENINITYLSLVVPTKNVRSPQLIT